MWLVAVLGLLCLALALTYSFMQAPIYTASTDVLVQPATASSAVAIRPEQLVSMETERRLVTSVQVAELAREQLGTSLSARELLRHVSVDTATEALVLTINFSDPDPEGAAPGADAFAVAYLEFRRQLALDAVLRERGAIEQQIAALQTEVQDQNAIIASSDVGSEARRNAVAVLDTLSGEIAVLSAQLASVPLDIDPGQVILPAQVPTAPSSPNHVLFGALGLFVGVFMGVTLAFVFDRLDERLRDRFDLEAALRAPVIGIIPHVKGWSRRDAPVLIASEDPYGPVAEAYRTLRTSLLSMVRQREIKTLMITSAVPGDGKSTTAANLSAVLASAGERVLLISADLRKPRIHQFFDIPNRQGLSDILEGRLPPSWSGNRDGDGVSVITSGPLRTNPAELLHSPMMAEVLDEQSKHYDVILVDCPPILGLADALTVAPLVDGVLLVAAPKVSRVGAVQQSREQIAQVGGRILGGVLNDVKVPRRDEYAYAYSYLEGSKTLPPDHGAEISTLEPGRRQGRALRKAARR
jgi:polysaccharide biosynthesis transport protein